MSAIIIFLNEERFLRQAIQSVLAQTYEAWELLLVDDGSSDGSAAIARDFAARRSEQIRYLRHPDGENRGMSASRNLGLNRASGDYVAFLDGDDVWMPEKLQQQVAILESQPEAAMVYGKTEYWHDWEPGAESWGRDRVQEHGIAANVLLPPPLALTLFLRGRAAVPSICSLLVRRGIASEVGGFEDAFRGLYEDQVFCAKICAQHTVYVSDSCLDRYRQHPASISSTSATDERSLTARRRYLTWLAEYLRRRGVGDGGLRQALLRERWQARVGRGPRRIDGWVRWLRKWRLRLEDSVLPASLHRWLWERRTLEPP